METSIFAETKEIESVSACWKSENFSVLGYKKGHPNWIHATEQNAYSDTLRSLLEVIPRTKPGQSSTSVILHNISFVTSAQRP
jgi:hypothetical protein